jgi:TonB family protein
LEFRAQDLPKNFCTASRYAMASETTGLTNAAAAGGAKPQPVAMEIPVTVNGASTVAGSDKRQPFSETTQTVLVFGSGAVIRLAAAVGPGQLLFVTNEKSKQEVVCQVVKTKQNGNGAGYVELKFTEAATDFWGIRTPGNGASSAAPAVPVSAAIGTNGAPAKPLEQRPADVKGTTTGAMQPSPVQIPPVTAPVPAPSTLPAAQRAEQANEIQAAPVVPAQPPTPKIPTLSEFLTQGSNGLELKARDRQLATTEGRETASAAPAAEKPLSERTTATQISSEHENKPSLSAALGVSQNPAAGSASFDLSTDLPSEEVKIPSWLEPLARNSAVAESKPAESKAIENKAAEVVSGVDLHLGENIAVSAPAEAVEEHAAAPILAGEGRAPNFGTSLALDSQTESSAGSGKGLKIALAIAALLIAAAAAWYWFVNQAPKVSAGGFGTVAEGNSASLPAPSANSLLNETAGTSAADTANERTALSTPVPQPVTAAGVGTRPASYAAGENSLIASTAKSTAPSSGLVNSSTDVVAEEPVRKPSLGQVRLAAPKVTRNDAAAENGTAEPGLALNAATPADSSGLSLLTNKGKGPAAPLPIGGDVKVAKLTSSVHPVYPQTARNQRVSGDVTVDAQIDASGRVTATCVISGPALLQEAAMSAVRQWKYQPATLNGIPTATHLTVTVQFKLQ